jgi:hypothetical protein
MNVQTDDTLHMRYDTDSQSLIITTPKGLSIALNDTDGSITLKDTHANMLKMGAHGIELCGHQIDIHANAMLTLRSSGTLTINGAMVMIN